jgi:hypothetical protein
MTHYLKIVGLLCAVLATAVAIDEGIVPRSKLSTFFASF